jgi:hypothetical protein
MNTICDYVGWGGEKTPFFSSWKPQIEEKGPKSHASLATHPFEGSFGYFSTIQSCEYKNLPHLQSVGLKPLVPLQLIN